MITSRKIDLIPTLLTLVMLWSYSGCTGRNAQPLPRPGVAPQQQQQTPPAQTAEEPQDAQQDRPGLLRRSLGILPFVSSGEQQAQTAPTAPDSPFDAKTSPRQSNLKGLELAIGVEPQNVDLSETKRLKVHIVLRNEGKRTRALKFSSSQHIEMMIRDESGRVVTRWSEDYVFNPVLTTQTVNPDERIEWKETISTRELEPGRQYTLDVAIVGYSALQVSKPLSPVR